MSKRIFGVGTAAALGLAAALGGYTGSAVANDTTSVTVVPEFYTAFTRNFNPFLSSRLHTTQQFIYEPLAVFNEAHGNEPVFRLATDYELADDLKSITFTLREGVKWSDGEAFNADDVVFSFNLVNDNEELDIEGINEWVERAVKVDEHTVRYELKAANSLIANEIVLTPIVPEHVWSDVDNPVTYTNENPVGTGPFTEIRDFSQNLYVQCENPNYWDAGNLDVDCLRVPQIANNDQLLAKLINGELDWTSSFVPDIEATYASKSENYNYWFPEAGTTALVLNYEAPAEGDREAINSISFRRALSMAVDREAVVDFAAYGYGAPNHDASGICANQAAWRDEAVYEQYQPYMTYTPEKAKAMLDEAGFTDADGDGFRETPSGKPIELTIITPNGWTDFNNVGMITAEMLGEVGIRAEASTPEFAVLNQKMARGDYDVSFTNYFYGPTPFTYFDRAYNSKYQAGEQFGRFAMHHFEDEKLDNLIDSFLKTPTKEARKGVVHKIQERIASQQITVPVYCSAYFYQYNTSDLTGWWNEDNARGRPMIWAGIPERLLHVLDLKPRQ